MTAPIIVNWHAPGSPTLRYHGGRAEEFFPSTAGWAWNEGKYLGEAVGANAVVTLLPPREFSGTPVNATVLVGEALALKFFELGVKAEMGKILVRVISPPSPTDVLGFWPTFSQYMPRISGLCTISEDTADKLDVWARMHGYKGPKVRCVRHGAVPRNAMWGQTAYGWGPINEGPRDGVVYLGSLIKEKRVPIVVEAARKAGVPIFLGVSVNTDRAREDMGAIEKLAMSYDLVSLATLGEIGKYEVLAAARAVVTASLHEAAWVSGIEGLANGLLYYDGSVEGLAGCIQHVHEDEFFAHEQARQVGWWREMGHDAKDVGKGLWEWIQEAGK